jgi:Zn-dependent protease/predicted transcriptional regulator
MKSSWRIGRIFGIDIKIDSSWIFIFVLVTWSLAGGYFPGGHPKWPFALNWGLGVLTSLLFFASVLAHELTHSLVAKKQGEEVTSITLFILGGVAQIKEEPDQPLKEFAMAVVGPLSSFLLAIFFAAVSLLAAPVSEPVKACAAYLAFVNLVLGAFNLLPGFPMDGGRVFRSIVWKITGDIKRATRAAAMVGEGIAYLMILTGVLKFLNIDIFQLLGLPTFLGGSASGLWLVLIGWFVHNASRQGYAQVMIKSALEGLKARDLMNTEFETIPAGLPVQVLVDDYILKKKERVFLVTVGGDLKGIVCLEDVRALPRSEWPQSPVSQIMTPKDKLLSVPLDADGSQVLAGLAERDVHQIPVMDGDRVAGVICRSDILRVLQLKSDLGV